MVPRLLVMFIPFVPVVVGVIIVVWAVRRNRAVVLDAQRYPGLASLRRSTMAARYVGFALAVVTFTVVTGLGELGRGLFAAPPAAGIVMLVAIMGGQQLAYGGARTEGVAGIEHRRVRDYVPRALSVTVTVLLALLLASGAWSTVVADVDEFGRERAFTVTGVQEIASGGGFEPVPVSSTQTPFPGAFYTVALGIGLPIVLLLGLLALRLTALRPRNGSDSQLVSADDALRRQTAEGVVAAIGLVASLSLAGVAAGAGLSVGGMHEFGVWYGLGGMLFGLLVIASIVVAIWCAVLVLVPGSGAVRTS